MNKDNTKQSTKIRKLLRVILKGLAGLLIICILAVGGILFWLRTESASGFISELATEQLSGLGIELSMGPMGGTLPSSLFLRDIVLSDVEGVFFRASGLSFEARLLSLFKGRLEIADISLKEPELLRLPQLPHSEPAEDTASSGIPSLPIGIRIEHIALTGGAVHAAVLSLDAKSETVFNLEMSGAASLEGSTLAALLKLDLLNADGTGLTMRLDLDAASGLAGLYAQRAGQPQATEAHTQTSSATAEDTLSLSLVMRENEKGLLALIMNDPAFPPYVFSLGGKGPVRDWKADLALFFGKDAPVAEAATGPVTGGGRKAEVFALASQLGLQCNTGSLWKDLLEQPDFVVSLKNELRAGARIPESLIPLTGELLKADISVASQGKGYGVGMTASSKAWRLSLENMHIAPLQDGETTNTWIEEDGVRHEKGLAIDGIINATVSDLPALMGLGGNNAIALPLESLTVSTSLSTLVDGGFSGVKASGNITAGGVSSAVITGQGPETAKEDLSVDYSLAARFTSPRASLDALSLHGLGISLQAKGTVDTSTMAVNAEASLNAEDNSRWQDILGRLSGFAAKDGVAPFGGSLAMNVDLKLPPRSMEEGAEIAGENTSGRETELSGNLRLNATNMRWPTMQLDKILGPSISASAKLGGDISQDNASPYLFELHELNAGILSAQGKASFLSSDPAGLGDLAAGRLKAALSASISDLAPLTTAETGQAAVSGPLKADLIAEGLLNALHLELDLGSPALNASGKSLKEITLKLKADTSRTTNLMSAAGDLALSLGQSPGGPMQLASRWKVDMPQGNGDKTPPMTAAVDGLKLFGAGMEVDGSVKATLPAGTFPKIQGSVRGAVKDWNKLAALSGAPLSGGPTDFTLVMDNQGRGQEARLNLQLASLRLQEKGSPPSFAVRDVKAALLASGLPDKLDIDLALDTGRGRGGPLTWKSGKGAVKGSNNNGNFSFSLEAQRPGRAGNARGQKNAVTTAKASELLALQGAYNLDKMEVLINTLALQQPRQKVGVELKKPLTVNFAKGIVLHGLEMGFQPEGRLTADADIAPGKLNLKLKLKELTFDFFKLFTPANLPDGNLMAEVDLQSAGGVPRGNIKIHSQVSATQDLSGVVARSSSGGGISVLELLVDGNISSSPGANAVAGSGVRSIPGVIWLNGTGSLGASTRQAESREGKLNFQIPMRAGSNGIPLPDSAAPMAIKLDWNGPVETLWQAIPMADRYLSGNALIDASVSGSMNAPKLLLSAYMAGGRFQDIPNGVLISGINLEARNTAEGDVRALVSAKDKQSGDLAMEANLTGLTGKPGAKANLSVRGHLKQFSPLHRDDLNIHLSGIFSAKGPIDELEVTSDITVTRGELVVNNKMGGGSVTTLDVVNKKRAGQEDDEELAISVGPKLNMHIKVPRYFFIRGMGINSEWAGDLRITGFASDPSLVGDLKPVRGTVDLFSRTFTIGEGEITFTGGMASNPALDLTLVNEGPTITAYVKVGGSAKKPVLTLESVPPLPHDEVLSMVLFGKRMSELSRFESIQLANSLRELSGFGGSTLDVLTGVRKTMGLDMLRVGGGSGEAQRSSSGQAGEGNLGAPKATETNGESTPTLEAGKYINDSIYVGVEQGMTQESTAVRVEVELYPSVTLQGKSTSESSEVGIGWKKDY